MLDTRGAVVSGAGVACALGQSQQELIRSLESGSFVRSRTFFRDGVAASSVLGFNPAYVPLADSSIVKARRNEKPGATMTRQLDSVISQAVHDAGLDESALADSRVQTYVGGAGMHPDILKCVAYLRRNDEVDLHAQPGIKDLHARAHSQEDFARALMQRYRLSRPPLCIFSASCSSMSALYLAAMAIQTGRIDLAVVITWQYITLYDLMFFFAIGGLSRNIAQPFSELSEGVLPAACVGAVVLRRGAPAITQQARIVGFATAQGVGGTKTATSFAPDFRTIARVISTALQNARIPAQEISCVFAHGNGIRGCDQAEALAVRKIWGEGAVPLVSYKAQTGYFIGGSALLDVAVIVDALQKRRVLASRSCALLDEKLGLRLHSDCDALQLKSGHVLKIAIGVDGSIAVGVFSQA